MNSVKIWTENFGFSDFADVVSVVGFCFTIWILFSLKRIRNYYLFKARVPELLKKLTAHGSRLAELDREFEKSRRTILLELGQLEVTLKYLKKRVGKDSRGTLAEIGKNISAYKRSGRKDNFWEIYISVQSLILEINNLQKDKNWENNHA